MNNKIIKNIGKAIGIIFIPGFLTAFIIYHIASYKKNKKAVMAE